MPGTDVKDYLIIYIFKMGTMFHVKHCPFFENKYRYKLFDLGKIIEFKNTIIYFYK